MASKLTDVGVTKNTDMAKPDFGPFFPDPVAKIPSVTPLAETHQCSYPLDVVVIVVVVGGALVTL